MLTFLTSQHITCVCGWNDVRSTILFFSVKIAKWIRLNVYTLIPHFSQNKWNPKSINQSIEIWNHWRKTYPS